MPPTKSAWIGLCVLSAKAVVHLKAGRCDGPAFCLRPYTTDLALRTWAKDHRLSPPGLRSAVRDQAVLRVVAGAVRLAINAARRAPRAQGMTVVSLAAVSTTDLMKRVLVFIVFFLWPVGLVPFD